ncbi:hypothetical protein BP5796_11116 [Coleophoma crateriformis]|uniref:GH18 domain-containing protein n=1 Tax=Coleophoma crateriformis TaxID=565419 RepID=A0A3D8QMY1_9HELO|nr:hypothetical protein BP5796_11116 [Coleophoma crateriformis]
MANGIGSEHFELRNDGMIDLPRDVTSLKTVLQQIQHLETEIQSLMARLHPRDVSGSDPVNNHRTLTANSDIWAAVVGPGGTISEQEETQAALSGASSSVSTARSAPAQGNAAATSGAIFLPVAISQVASSAPSKSPAAIIPIAESQVLPLGAVMPVASQQPAAISPVAPAPAPSTSAAPNQPAASSIIVSLSTPAVVGNTASTSQVASPASSSLGSGNSQPAVPAAPAPVSTAAASSQAASSASFTPVWVNGDPATSAAVVDNSPTSGVASPAGSLIVLPFLPRATECTATSSSYDGAVNTTSTRTVTSKVTSRAYVTVIVTAQADLDESAATEIVNSDSAGAIQIQASATTASSQRDSSGGVFLENVVNANSQTTQAAQPMAYNIGLPSESTLSAVATSPSSEPSGSSNYVFNAQSSENIAVYFGQTGATSLDSLSELCADPSIDIVILAFVIAQLDGGIYPQVNFGSACGGQTAAMKSEAPGLLSCPLLAAEIEKCQSVYNKKVLLSIGGATSQISFTTPDEAIIFASVLWELFGPVGKTSVNLRPFGNVSVDGFDIDNEDNLPNFYDKFASTLRSHYSSTSSKTYYLSSAPQCPYPDASNPLAMLLLCDFVWVQFYNNAGCEIGSSDFSTSVEGWSAHLQSSTLNPPPRLYIGAPSFPAAGSTAYSAIGSAGGMENIAKEVKSIGVSNLGGIMFWDGSEGLDNVQNGKTIIDYAKIGLTS